MAKLKAINDLIGKDEDKLYPWQKDAKKAVDMMAKQLSQNLDRDVKVTKPRVVTWIKGDVE